MFHMHSFDFFQDPWKTELFRKNKSVNVKGETRSPGFGPFQAQSLLFHLTAVPGGRIPEVSCQIQLTNMGKLNTLAVEIISEF